LFACATVYDTVTAERGVSGDQRTDAAAHGAVDFSEFTVFGDRVSVIAGLAVALVGESVAAIRCRT
jgi:hypothetical protein